MIEQNGEVMGEKNEILTVIGENFEGCRCGNWIRQCDRYNLDNYIAVVLNVSGVTGVNCIQWC